MPEAALDEAEAKELTQALAAVNSYYATAIDPKKLAWFALFGIAGKIYGPRVMALMLRLKTEKTPPRPSPLAGTPPQQTAKVTPLAQRAQAASNGVPPGFRATVSDPTFVSDISSDE